MSRPTRKNLFVRFEKSLSAICKIPLWKKSRVGLRKKLCRARQTFILGQTRTAIGLGLVSVLMDCVYRRGIPCGCPICVGADRCVCPKRNVSHFMPQVSVVACNKLNHCMLLTDTPVVGYRSQKIMPRRHPPSGVSVCNVHVYCKLRSTTYTRNLKGRNFFSYVFMYVLREAHRHKY